MIRTSYMATHTDEMPTGCWIIERGKSWESYHNNASNFDRLLVMIDRSLVAI
jgi:hypothetical protein